MEEGCVGGATWLMGSASVGAGGRSRRGMAGRRVCARGGKKGGVSVESGLVGVGSGRQVRFGAGGRVRVRARETSQGRGDGDS